MRQPGVLISVFTGVAAAIVTVHAETRVILTRERCRLLVAHVPAADVAARPGRDAKGRSVVPADLEPAQAVALPDDITIDITAAVFALIEREPPRGLAPSEIELGRVAFGRDGWITYNGQRLGDSVQDALVALCQDRAAATPPLGSTVP
ncbi:MAG: hypothetical protein FJ318_10670 [SAR202 cluster bacterium]|nr:hypothetical protein [SAR202 cluster bacterium]